MNQDVLPWIAQLVPAYLKRRAAELQTIECVLQAGRLEDIQRVGHNLKGTGSGYGFPEVTNIGRRREAAAKAGN